MAGTRTDWTRNFWTKAAAFFLAVMLVPIIAAYGVSAAFAYDDGWYSTPKLSFTDTGICEDVVLREQGGLWVAYQAIDPSEFGALYPAQNQASNYRFALYGKDGSVLYDNHRETDRFIRQMEYRQEGYDEIIIKSYITAELTAQDDLYWANQFFETAYAMSDHAIAVCGAGIILLLILILFLARVAGRRTGTEEATAGWQEKIPFDLYLSGVGLAACLMILAAGEFRYGTGLTHPWLIAVSLAGVTGCAVLFLATWMTFCARVKIGKWWHNTAIYMVLRLCRKILRKLTEGVGRIGHALPMVWRTSLGFGIVTLTIMHLSTHYAYGRLFSLLGLLYIVTCMIILQLRRLQKAGEELAAGDLTPKVDTNRMFWDFKRHGENLNAVGKGMSIAVEQQLKSERLKTELITNVSHDIKTPLTSIINYVDLLQKGPAPEQQREYLQVLNRQAHRLKKLMEDLIEMSKASTGNLPCHPSRRNVKELIEQAVGEYEDRLLDAQIEPVISLPEKSLFCLADGALMWRILENLLSNVCKYAQCGTRLYIDITEKDGFVAFSFKNISRDRLNISAEELTERFVRGDISRTTEGSGLGLNIAGSLVELQGGKFRLNVDGDLFKAEFQIPLDPSS